MISWYNSFVIYVLSHLELAFFPLCPAPVHDMSLGNPVQESPRGCRVMMRHDVSFRSMCPIKFNTKVSFSELLPNDIQVYDVAWWIGRVLQFVHPFVLCLHIAYMVTPTVGVWCQLMSVTRSVGPLCCGGICHRAPVPLLACQKQ